MIRYAAKEILPIPTANCHASSIALLDGDILLSWFGGTEEKNPDVDIYMARKTADGWSDAWRVAGQDNLAHWNPVLFAEGNQVTLYYKVGIDVPHWYTRVMRSSDGGRSFSSFSDLVPGDVGGRGPVRNHMLRLSSGRLLAPASIETAACWEAFVDISEDNGHTFRKSAFVPLNRPQTPCSGFPVHGKGVIQPALWQSADENVHMLLRSTEGYILRSDSSDEGETWSPAYSTALPNNNSGIDLVQLDDGRIALVMNPVSDNWGARTPLSLYVSQDGGDSFTRLMHLETQPGEFSYPSIAARGNRLFISYTWKRLKIAYWEIELEPRA